MRNTLELWRSNSPWSVLNDVDKIMSQFLQPAFNGGENQSLLNFTPAYEVDEHEDHYLISLDIPGVSKNDVKVEVVDEKLVITGERKSEKRETEGRRYGRFYGKFERTFKLPTDVDFDKIEARFENGVLELAVPKAEAARPRTIAIQNGKENFFGRFLGKGKASEASPSEKPLHS